MSASPVRQGILSAPLLPTYPYPVLFDFAGVPSGYLPVTQHVSASHPLIVTAAKGFGATGAVDRIGLSTTNLTWPEVPHDDAFYLYVTVQSTGTLVPGFTTLPPIYQEYGTPSIVAGQHTYNILEATMYVGNGTVAKPVYRVFLGYGWGSTPQGRITAFRPQAALGRWTSPLHALPTPGSPLRLDDTFLPGHLVTARWVAVCVSNDGAYLPGNEVPLAAFAGCFTEVVDASGYVRVDANPIPPQILGPLGTLVPLTPSHWQTRCYLTRAW